MTEISTIVAVGGFSAPETTEGAVLTDALGKNQAPAELVERFRNAMAQSSASHQEITAFPQPKALPSQPTVLPAEADILPVQTQADAMAPAPVLFQGMPVVTPEILPLADEATQPGMPPETLPQPQLVANMAERNVSTLATAAGTVEMTSAAMAAENPEGAQKMAVQPQPGAASAFAETAELGKTEVFPASSYEVPVAAAPVISEKSVVAPAVVPEMPSQGVVSAEPAGTTVPSGVPTALPVEGEGGTAMKPGVSAEGGRFVQAKDSVTTVVSADTKVAADSEEVSAGISQHVSGKETAQPVLAKSAKSVSTVENFKKSNDVMAEEEIPDALPAAPQVVLQATPLTVTPDAAGALPSVDAAGAVAAAASARTQNLVEVAEQVCDAILVSPGLVKGEGEIRLQLKADVLDGTEIRIEAKSSALAVSFQPVTSEAQYLLERHISQFEQHLAGRIHNYQISVSVRRSKQNERA